MAACKPKGTRNTGHGVLSLELMLADVFIVAYGRTPIGSAFTGSLAELSASELGAAAMRGCLDRLEASSVFCRGRHVDEVILGHALQAGCGQAPATQASIAAGISNHIPSWSVNKVCASGAKAVSLAAALVRNGEAECVVAGGMESMSRVPHACPLELRLPGRGLRYGHGQLKDLLQSDGLTDAFEDILMGECAERIAAEEGIMRMEMDAFGRRSFERAIASAAVFKEYEIFPLPGTLEADEGPKSFRPEKDFSTLKTPFRPVGGRISAATSSQLSDGAAALVLMSATRAAELNVCPIARILASADASGPPDRFPLAPIDAVRRACTKASLSPAKDIDLFEINEAFAVAPIAVARRLGLADEDIEERVNVLGGAVALGHPLGCSGARIICTLITALRLKGKKVGCAAVCNGGGGGSAIVIELV
jgi:acetyl-CoA C-acetyltransferase